MESVVSTKHRRLCHINLAAGYRGGERQTELLLKELGRRGWSQRLVVRSGSALVRRCRDVSDLEIAEVNAQPFSAALAARGAALVHAHEARAVYSGWLLKMTAGTPFVLTRRIHHSPSRSFARTMAYRASDSVVAISLSIAESVSAHYGDLKCRVVPSAHANMCNGKAVKSAVLGHLRGKTIIGHVGELDHSHKGQKTIIEAARHLAQSHPALHFVLLGEGKDERALRRAADGLDNVELIGFVENVEDYMGAFDVFVYPSLHEGLGSSLLDAMACGLPIVASEVGGIPEIVDHRVNGLLVPPGDASALAAALEQVIGDPGLRATMQRANREKVAGFSVDRMTSAYEDIYRTILRVPTV